eukprot:Sspe_Gene.57129::Locus_31367_Transcript_1_1_Confidence_1.000_Length_1906::g.57129::m.57129/K14209/SLC36A, PAT; solute carrier family 36 (proton-coupled amino acid transporter)
MPDNRASFNSSTTPIDIVNELAAEEEERSSAVPISQSQVSPSLSPFIPPSPNDLVGQDVDDILSRPGGDVTLHIYQAADRMAATGEIDSILSQPLVGTGGVNSRAVRTLGTVAELHGTDEFETAALSAAMKEPQGMRRVHIATERRRPGTMSTDISYLGSFLDSLSHFGGRDLTEYDEDEEPLLPPAMNTDGQTFLTLLKAFIGPAHLYLAKGFADGGIILSIIGLFFCCMLNAFCVSLLVKAYKAVGGGSFSEIGEMAFGKRMYVAVETCLVASQLGLVTMYFIFVAETVRDSIAHFADCASWATHLSLPMMIWIQVAIQLPMALLRRLNSIAFFAILADVLILTAMAWVITENLREVVYIPHDELPPITAIQSKFPMFFGTAVLTFEGIGLMLPVHEAMQNKEKFVPMVWLSMMFCCVLFTVFALLGYLARGGEHVNVNLLLAMRENSLSQTSKLLYSLAVTLTFPLQAFPAYRIIELALHMRSGKRNPVVKWRKNCLRCSIVVALGGIAWLGSSSLGNFVALLGGLTMCPLAFVFPSLFHYRLAATTKLQRAVDASVAGFGILIVLLVTGMAIHQWVVGEGESTVACVP